MYKSTNDLKETLGIDITEKNRTIPYVALRCFYAEMRVEQLEGRISKRYTIVSKEIGCGRDNVYNLITKGKLFKKDECVKIIFEAFKTKEKTLLKEYEKQLIKTKALKNSERTLKMFNDGFNYAQTPRGKKSMVVKMSNLKLSEFLRANSILKHELWDTPVRNISDAQWIKARNINENMFDLINNL